MTTRGPAERTLHGDGLANARDLGGLRRTDGTRTPSGVFFRSDNVDRLTPAGWDAVADAGVRTIVDTALYYLPHLEAMPERAAAALSAIVSAPPGAVVFHCMGGRDRTGMIAMLLLMAADVGPDEIVDDYLETVRRGELRAAQLDRNNDEAELDALCRSRGTTTEGAFRTVVQALRLRSVLDAGGMRPENREALMSWRGAH